MELRNNFRHHGDKEPDKTSRFDHKYGRSNWLDALQDSMAPRSIADLKLIAEKIDFDNVPRDLHRARLWVADAIDLFVEVDSPDNMHSGSGCTNGQPNTGKPVEAHAGIIAQSKPHLRATTDVEIERDREADALTNWTRHRLRQRISCEADRTPCTSAKAKQNWLRRRYDQLDQKLARANLQSSLSSEQFAALLFTSSGPVPTEVSHRDRCGRDLLNVLLPSSTSIERKWVTSLHTSLNNKARTNKNALLAALHILASDSNVMGHVLSTLASNMSAVGQPQPRPSNGVDTIDADSTSEVSTLTSHNSSRDTDETEEFVSDEEKKQKMQQQLQLYRKATEIVLQIKSIDLLCYLTPHAPPPPLYTPQGMYYPMPVMADPRHNFGQALQYSGIPAASNHPKTANTASARPLKRSQQAYQSTSSSKDVAMAKQNPFSVPASKPRDGAQAEIQTSNPRKSLIVTLKLKQKANEVNNGREIGHAIGDVDQNNEEGADTSIMQGQKRKRESARVNKGKHKARVDEIDPSDMELGIDFDVIEDKGELYPQTLDQMDSFLALANGGTLTGSTSSNHKMDTDDDATEPDTSPDAPIPKLPSQAAKLHGDSTLMAELESTNNAGLVPPPIRSFGTSAVDDPDVQGLVHSIVSNIRQIRTWPLQLPPVPDAYGTAMKEIQHAEQLASELHKVMALTRPMKNAFMTKELALTICDFYGKLFAFTNAPTMPRQVYQPMYYPPQTVYQRLPPLPTPQHILPSNAPPLKPPIHPYQESQENTSSLAQLHHPNPHAGPMPQPPPSLDDSESPPLSPYPVNYQPSPPQTTLPKPRGRPRLIKNSKTVIRLKLTSPSLPSRSHPSEKQHPRPSELPSQGVALSRGRPLNLIGRVMESRDPEEANEPDQGQDPDQSQQPEAQGSTSLQEGRPRRGRKPKRFFEDTVTL